MTFQGNTPSTLVWYVEHHGGYIRQLKPEAKEKFIIDDSDFVDTDKTFADVFPNIEQEKLYYVDDESYSVEEVTEG